MDKIAIITGLLDWGLRKFIIKVAAFAPCKFLINENQLPILPAMSAWEYVFLREIMRKHSNYAYIEYGCGGSTVLADRYFSYVNSADTDARWCNRINKVLRNGNVRHIEVGELGEWGSPMVLSAENATKIAGIHQDTLKHIKARGDRVLFLIDGRCRVLTACIIFQYLQDCDLVLIHDFSIRNEYYCILQVYDIVSVRGNLALLRKNSSPDCAAYALKLIESHISDFR
jgi:hypothetical protein